MVVLGLTVALIAASPSPALLAHARLALEDAVAARPSPRASIAADSAPVFVTVILDGKTRACQGSLAPITPRLDEEIAAVARRAAQGDARHPPLTRGELSRARIVLSFPEALRPWEGIPVDPRRWGLVVETAAGAGVLLPGEARTFEWMLAEARRRAGATRQEPGSVHVFRTRTLGEGGVALPAIEGVSR